MSGDKSSKKSKKDKKDSKKEKKEKKEPKITKKGDEITTSQTDEVDYDKYLHHVSPISKPLASKKITTTILKTTKKAAQSRALRRGVKEVVKAVRKGEKGIVVIAGNTYPIDVISHIPVLCEDQDIPYCFVPSKEHLGAAGSTKRPTSVVMIKSHADYEDVFKTLRKEIKDILIQY